MKTTTAAEHESEIETSVSSEALKTFEELKNENSPDNMFTFGLLCVEDTATNKIGFTNKQ